MPLQTDADFRQNVAAVKDLLGLIVPEKVNAFSRHGSSKRNASSLVAPGNSVRNLDPVKVVPAFNGILLIPDLSTRRTPLLNELLSVAVKADESQRPSRRASRNYPRKEPVAKPVTY